MFTVEKMALGYHRLIMHAPKWDVYNFVYWCAQKSVVLLENIPAEWQPEPLDLEYQQNMLWCEPDRPRRFSFVVDDDTLVYLKLAL